MADDQVKYSDLIADDVVKGFELLNQTLKELQTTMADLKTEAAGVGSVIKGVGSANRDQQHEIARLASEVERLKNQMKGLKDEEKKVTEIKRRYKKLTDEQIQAVNAFQQALRGSSEEQLKAVSSIDMQTKSYNELQAMYNALKDSLNAMTVAERESSAAGKAMTAQSAKIYDMMNELQKATGKYTMQVGKYRAAFDGLGYSFLQIAREAPSALNLNQFFLAISNNIPMFLDQLKAFKNEQDQIKANLSTMTQGTAEYAEQAGKVMSVGQKLLGVIKSWQFGILAVLLLIRKIDWGKLWNNLKKTFQGVKEVKNEITSTAALGEMMVEVAKKTADEVSELNLVVDRLREVKAGTDEWKAGIETVNKITKKNLDTTTSTISEVEKVTKAYTDQAIQLAKNAALTDMIGKSEANKTLRKIAYDANDYETARQALGLTIDSKDEKAFRDLYDKMEEREASMNKGGWSFRLPGDNRSSRQIYNEAVQEYRNFINKRLSVLSDDAKKQLEEEYELINPLKKDKKGRSYSLKDVDFLESELLDKDAVIELESSFERRLAMLEEEQLKERLVLKEKYEKELKDLEFNHEKHLITDKEYNEQRAKLDKNYNDLIKTNYEGNFEEMGVIQRKYWNKRNALTEKEAKRQEEEAEKIEKAAAKARYKAVADEWQMERTQLVERGAKRKELIEAEITAEVARLNAMLEMERSVNGEMMSEEEEAKIREWITLLEQFKAAGNFNQINAGQIFGNGASNIGKKERGNYTNITDLLFGDSMTKDQQSSLSSVFDQAKEALNSWMDARKAAADQAKELADDEVSAAEQALNREIELRNQGYANDVALRERELADAKKAQKEAAMEQQKIAKEQVLLDAAMQASSMITASANILKNFPNPVAWVPMLATMWGAFAYAKVKAYQSANKTLKFREGGVMLLEGGSHESGHDVNLGIGPDGSNLRAEGGEYFAVINKRNSRRYGREIPGIVNALNSGVFEDRYIKTSDAAGLVGAMGAMSAATESGRGVDLSAVEKGVQELVKQGDEKWSSEGNYRVMRYKNLVRRVKVN